MPSFFCSFFAAAAPAANGAPDVIAAGVELIASDDSMTAPKAAGDDLIEGVSVAKAGCGQLGRCQRQGLAHPRP